MDPAEALGVLLGAKVAAKVCAGIGSFLMLFGWLRSKSGRAFGKGIVALSEDDESEEQGERREWSRVRQSLETLHESVQKVIWELGEVKRDLVRSETAREKDHARIGDAILDLTYVKAQLESLSDHCEHCPSGRR